MFMIMPLLVTSQTYISFIHFHSHTTHFSYHQIILTQDANIHNNLYIIVTLTPSQYINLPHAVLNWPIHFMFHWFWLKKMVRKKPCSHDRDHHIHVWNLNQNQMRLQSQSNVQSQTWQHSLLYNFIQFITPCDVWPTWRNFSSSN